MSAAIRQVRDDDFDTIDRVIGSAFGGDGEVALVRRLRGDRNVVLELVAEDGGAIVGHILLSHLMTEMDGRAVKAVALAPVSVLPDRQNQGIGGQLIQAALAEAETSGWEAVVLLGHPDYYPRFGFSAELAARLQAPFHGPAFMALELSPGALAGTEGSVIYPAAFEIDGLH